MIKNEPVMGRVLPLFCIGTPGKASLIQCHLKRRGEQAIQINGGREFQAKVNENGE